MNKVWRIARHEYTHHVLRRRFLFGLLSVPAIMAVMALVVLLLIRTEIDNRPVGYVDPSGLLAEPQPAPLPPAPDRPVEMVPFETEAQATKGDPLSFIITDMAQNEHLRESMDLAESIQRGMRTVHPGPDRGVKQANFAVLRGAFMPAVLVEIGFGTNPQDAAYMCSSRGQRELARTIAAGAVEYLSHYEQRIGGGR